MSTPDDFHFSICMKQSQKILSLNSHKKKIKPEIVLIQIRKSFRNDLSDRVIKIHKHVVKRESVLKNSEPVWMNLKKSEISLSLKQVTVTKKSQRV